LLKYAKIDPKLMASATRVRYGDRLLPRLIQPAINVAAKYGKFDAFPGADLIYKPAR